jgi:hypothetical protein
MRCEELLRVAGRLEPPHGPLALAGRLMGILRPVVQIAVLPMLYAREELLLGCPIAG